jgi:hypothetical protein
MDNRSENLREFVENLRQEWKTMWWSRIEDKVRAESIADKTYEHLFVDRGTILMATRKYSPPDFQKILAEYLQPEEVGRANPSPTTGGMGKFIREYIVTQNTPKSRRKEVSAELENMKKHQQLKKGGRGWLHISMKASPK